ncbi:MAG: penicillin-binding protein 1A, partial [Sphingomonadales bacterium]|nr:penicillin-binding protein 1A [Sphingomonadales bacterium]
MTKVKENKKAIKAKKKKSKLRTFVGVVAVLLLFGSMAGAVGLFMILSHYGRDLPDYTQLADYEPPVVTRIHAGDGSLLTEFARQRRLFVPINAVPDHVIEAFLAAEDKNFYNHSGFDVLGIGRAMLTNVKNAGTGRPLVGASTLTQQVAKNFLLSSDQRLERKIKEAILTFRIEKAFSKDQILELYLNEIYFGYGAYGLASAALNYFNKSLEQLNIEEAAYLAAVPKGPPRYHPIRHYERAIGRRNWVLGRMEINGFISEAEMTTAQATELVVHPRERVRYFHADYFEEQVRRQLYSVYGQNSLYEGGLSVRTTLEPRLQGIAERALKRGLIAYDRRHGWRGSIDSISIADDSWSDTLGEMDVPLGMDNWHLAVVLELEEGGAVIGFEGGGYGFIHLDEVKWARAWRTGERLGPRIDDVGDVLELGDVVAVEEIFDISKEKNLQGFLTASGEPVGDVKGYGLRQTPAIEGALVALDPHTGRVLAMVGGYDYNRSQFNRATQAERQPGSSFKPFVYGASFEEGFTPSSLVLDAPFVMAQGEGQGMWKPSNSSNRFYGPSTLRLGMEKSRNLMTVRLAQYIGMDKVIDFASRFGIDKNLQPTLSMSLGAGEVSLLALTNAYGMLVNGGKSITPTLLDRIQDRRGNTIFRHDNRSCLGCKQDEWNGQDTPIIPDEREQVVDSRIAYQIVSMLEGVVERGTGRRIGTLDTPLAGKTGTTNDWVDAWFVGFSPDLVVGVFTGFDRPRSLGVNEEGSAIAAPIFREFMAEALKDSPIVPFRIPSGIRLVRVNAETGLPAGVNTTNAFFEAFIPGTEPTDEM